MRALAWEFPNDPSLAAADRQFFLGPAILVTPVLDQGATSVDGVFPGSGKGTVYYDWYTLSAVPDVGPRENVTISAPLGHIPVYIRGGHVLPVRMYISKHLLSLLCSPLNSESCFKSKEKKLRSRDSYADSEISIEEPALTTRDSRKNPWGLLAALSLEGTASGSLYIDDGESVVQNATLYVDFTVARNALYASPRGAYVERNPLANVTIMGVTTAPRKVTLNGATIAAEGLKYNSSSQVLSVTGLHDVTKTGAFSGEWVLRWG